MSDCSHATLVTVNVERFCFRAV